MFVCTYCLTKGQRTSIHNGDLTYFTYFTSSATNRNYFLTLEGQRNGTYTINNRLKNYLGGYRIERNRTYTINNRLKNYLGGHVSSKEMKLIPPITG